MPKKYLIKYLDMVCILYRSVYNKPGMNSKQKRFVLKIKK